jgi:hypothetical protein
MRPVFRKPIARFLASAALALCSTTAWSLDREQWDQCRATQDSDGNLNHEPRLCTYEPTTIGLTKDSDDVGFMDFKLSVRYQIFPFPEASKPWAWYFAFTGRFAQYLGTRDSSPVVTKRLNPKVFFRHTSGKDYFDIGYNHESNGQAINTLDGFNQAKATAELKDQKSNAAYDQISRGWDYLDFVYRKSDVAWSGDGYVVLKYFLPVGLLQGKAEEYGTNFAESDPEGKPRKQVNGVSAMFKRRFGKDHKLFASYETGYDHMFKYNTFRGEWGFRVGHLPLMLWGQTGYGSDLAQYYKKVSSAGIAVEIGSF